VRSLAPGSSDGTVEPAEPFDGNRFVKLMESVSIRIFLDDSDEDENEDEDEDDEDGDGDAVMAAVADNPVVGTYLNPLDLSGWGS
jgi:hypothetical protein